MASLLSVNVGMPQDIAWKGKTVHTGVWKHSVDGAHMARRLNIDGDGQGDLVGHGGEQRAVFVYQIDSYHYWERELGRSDFVYGQFGDNFTVDGLADDEVCIGDRYRIGGALFEVTQPRVTCYRVGIRMDEPRMPALLVARHRPGFYFRVLEEGEVAAGDDIAKVADGPHRLTVASADALLYLPGHDPALLEKALRIPALSQGWKTSFRALAEQHHEGGLSGNAGLAPDIGPAPAWPGFRPMRVTTTFVESSSVFSLDLEPADHEPLAPAGPGQFITLRLPSADGVLLRSYSLSGPTSAPRYRISVKQEPRGAAGAYLRDVVKPGDTLDVAAPRGAFLLRAGTRPVALVSAGIGATPVLAMLHFLAEQASRRAVWWIYGARDSGEHPFAREVEGLLRRIPHSHRYVAYSHPARDDRLGAEFDFAGHLSVDVVRRVGVPRDAEFYLCGPDAFMRDLTAGLHTWGVPAGRIHTEIFGPGQAITPGVVAEREAGTRAPHPPSGLPGVGPNVSFARSGLSVAWDDRYASLLELAETCDVTVRWSCRTGVCHTCVTSLLNGNVRYQPEPLERPGEDDVLICCASPEDDIVLDL